MIKNRLRNWIRAQLSAMVVMMILGALVSGCGDSSSCSDASDVQATDYSLQAHWLKVPETIDKEADVFYLYPTAWAKTGPTDPNIAEIDNASMLAGSAAAYTRQATAFEPVGNVYAPYYRQVDAAYSLSLPADERDELIASVPAADAEAALDYYFKHYNNGRPLLLVGHSQGSNVLILLLSDYFKNHPEYLERMVVAYVIGYSVTTDFLAANPHLHFAQGPDDTGVIVSYNTVSPDVNFDDAPFLLPGAVTINPISWTLEETPATAEEGLGSFMPDAHGVFQQVPQYADARVDRSKGVVLCSTAVDDELLLGFGPGVYHSYDIPFYYFNLRANAANRVEKYLGAKGTTAEVSGTEAIRRLEPHDVFGFFADVVQVPRPSGSLDGIRQYLKEFGAQWGIETTEDAAGNVIMRKPATAGMEDRMGVILQAHMDIVAAKLEGIEHDFENDPIDAYIDGEVIKAWGTTLGADDGAGIALILALFAADDLVHGPLEALFTADEETTFSGIDGLSPYELWGDLYINLDNEEEGQFCIGSAGGQDVWIDLSYVPETADVTGTGYVIEVGGLMGGHSGVDINLGRGNAILILSQLLQGAAPYGLRVSLLEGGEASNAIPRSAQAVFTLAPEQAAAFASYVADFEAAIRTELGADDPGLTISLSETNLPTDVLNRETQDSLIAAIVATPNGALEMSTDVPDLVETSSNIGVLSAGEAQISISILTRSFDDDALPGLSESIAQAYEATEADISFGNVFHAWTPNLDSALLALMTTVYTDTFGVEPVISAVHAGLECGDALIIYPHLDMISIGPTIRYVHTPNEEMEVASVGMVWTLLGRTLANAPKK